MCREAGGELREDLRGQRLIRGCGLRGWGCGLGRRQTFGDGTAEEATRQHRLFSHISQNWRGRPLVDYGTIVNLIGNTHASTGLRVECHLDTNKYPKGTRVSKKELSALNPHSAPIGLEEARKN